MSALLAFVAGVVAAAGLWRAMAPQFHESEVLRRQNYRGHALPVASGVIVVLAVVLVCATYSVWIRFGADAPIEQVRLANLLAYSGTALGYGLLGLLDDLVAAGIALEVCPTSNVHLGVYRQSSDVPLRRLVDAGATVALGADDPLLFLSRLTDQYQLARDRLGFSDDELAALARSSIVASLASEGDKTRWLSEVDAWLKD